MLAAIKLQHVQDGEARYILKKRRLRGDMTTVFKYLKDCHVEDEADFIAVVKP